MKTSHSNQPLILTIFLVIFFLTGLTLAATPDPQISPTPVANSFPATVFNLDGWKLQIPGPQDILGLSNYSSQHFYLNSAGQMCFWVDCAEKGHTANTEYIRSELRHLPNWSIDTNHTLSAQIQVNSQANPDKITVMQIHGITASGGNAPPLLRVALNSGKLYAYVKKDNIGEATDSVELAPGIGKQEFSCTVQVVNKHIIISVNGTQKFDRDFSFWKYQNYFKAGCYPQSLHGTVTVMFSKLAVN